MESTTPPPTAPGWIAAGGTVWRPLRPGEPRRWGDRWLRLDDGGRFGWCRSMSAIQQQAAALRRRGCDALPMRPETQRGPFPPPVYANGTRPGTRDVGGLAALFARARATPPPASAPPGTTGGELRKRREALGLSQRDAAARADLSRGMVDAIESGSRSAESPSAAAYEMALAAAERALGGRR